MSDETIRRDEREGECNREWVARARCRACGMVGHLHERLAEREAEDEALHDLVRRRERPWVERWQRETGNADDYGELLGKAEGAEAALARVWSELHRRRRGVETIARVLEPQARAALDAPEGA